MNDQDVVVNPTEVGLSTEDEMEQMKKKRRCWSFFFVLLLDVTASVVLMTSFIPKISQREGTSQHFTFSGSVFDLFILSVLRFIFANIAFLISFWKGEIRPEYSFDILHKNGTKKSREELEQEALEQSFLSWLKRYTMRPAFLCEVLALVTSVLCIVKCLVRLDREIGTLADSDPIHPLLWTAILISALFSVIEIIFLDPVCQILSNLGHLDRERGEGSVLRHISSTLSLPLLLDDSLAGNNDDDDEEEGNDDSNEVSEEDAPGISDIGGDALYKATWSDLLSLCKPDFYLIFLAFIFLLLAAAAQIFIPKYTGAILDALAETFSGDDDDSPQSMADVPGFSSNVKKLIVASILGGVFSGVRGSIFTVVGGRVNVRLRMKLMDSLLVQDIGFFDTTKTGDITSRRKYILDPIIFHLKKKQGLKRFLTLFFR